ncbi:MAG: polysaccharide biosynthesis C-terminal domain-containing protein [Oscillospiraceae bacterium]|nr:polysaccharide biosynthesis C-terminal domain-containing protein [Oscillospiraceae bacterium]
MDLLNGNVRSLYFRQLAAAFGSALISSIYAIVDAAAVGQYHGPDGAAALAVFAPVWNIVYSFGLLAGVGGSVLFAASRGEGKERESNEYFTAAMLLGALLSVLAAALIIPNDEALFRFFGADDTLLPYLNDYFTFIKFSMICSLFSQVVAAFLRNDGAPRLAARAVFFGGFLNLWGDWYLVFVKDMGIYGAGLTTALGSTATLLLMLTHFVGKKNTLRLVRPAALGEKLRRVFAVGFPTGILDIAMGVMSLLFNRQIMYYLGVDALSVYSVIVNVSTFVQCCAYSVGQAAQPIFSTAFGAKKNERIRTCFRYAMGSAVAFGVFWTLLSMLIPNGYVRFFMTPTPAVLAIAPGIIRAYSLSFTLLAVNVFSTFYFQSILQKRSSMIISLARGCFLSGASIVLLPRLLGANAVWYAMPLTEVLVAVYVLKKLAESRKQLEE